MIDAMRGFDVVRVRAGRRLSEVDQAVTEEPLEVRLGGRSFAVIMRTPGADRELTAGFLLAERVIRSSDDLGTIEHCRETPAAAEVRLKPDATGAKAPPENVINVTLVGNALETVEQFLAERRQVTTTSSCGLCGRQTIESLKVDAPPPVIDRAVRRSVIEALPARLRSAQTTFEATGGLHAAGLFALDGTLEGVAEDVGRHNAVDKVVGRMLMMDALPLSNRVLFVSGRASFEIVQKALLGGIPVVASVSAPSSLAIDLARDAGLTLVGFLRGDSFNIYSHPERIE
jgi:FdhD protein